MIVVINYVIPEDVSVEPKTFVVFDYDAPVDIIDVYEDQGAIILETTEAMDLSLRENLQSIGMIFRDGTTVEYRLQGHENQRYKEFLELNTRFMFEEYYGQVDVEVTSLKDFSQVEDVPFNKLLLPLFHVMEPALLGMFLIASMIFLEKEEGTITVYATTPSSINNFILSKTIVLVLFGLFSLVLTTLLVAGFSANYFQLIILTIICSFMGSALGLLLASFFDNIASAMMWIIGGASLLFSMPFVAYFSPSFAPPLWMKALPTYYMLFAYKEAVFPTGNPDIVYTTMGLCLVIGVVAYGLSLVKYTKSFKSL